MMVDAISHFLINNLPKEHRETTLNH